MTCVVVNCPWNIKLECHKHEGCGQNACSSLLNCNLKPITVTSHTVVEILSYWQICKSADKSIIATWRKCGRLWIKGPRFQPYLQHGYIVSCGGNFYMCTHRGPEIQQELTYPNMLGPRGVWISETILFVYSADYFPFNAQQIFVNIIILGFR